MTDVRDKEIDSMVKFLKQMIGADVEIDRIVDLKKDGLGISIITSGLTGPNMDMLQKNGFRFEKIVPHGKNIRISMSHACPEGGEE